MAKYTRFRTLLEVSDTSDYAKADFAGTEEEETTSTQTRVKETLIAVITTGTTLSLAHLTTCKRLVITNKDATNYVTLTYKTNAGVATTQTMKLLAGETTVLCDVLPTTNPVLTANSANCTCEVSYEGT